VIATWQKISSSAALWIGADALKFCGEAMVHRGEFQKVQALFCGVSLLSPGKHFACPLAVQRCLRRILQSLKPLFA